MQDIVADQLRQTLAVLTDVAKDSELHAVLVAQRRKLQRPSRPAIS